MVIVGKSAKSRKGTAWNIIKRLFTIADPDWVKRIASGLSSGEGVIYSVRDTITKPEAGGSEIVIDPGVSDKRLLIMESEFASPLKVAKREGNTMTAVIRDAWDSSNLQTMTKNSPAKATDPHISIIGHITIPELKKMLDSTDCLNGFANRFLWISAQRSKLLPRGGNPSEEEFNGLARILAIRLDKARQVQRMERSPEAEILWEEVYPRLTDEKPGTMGAVTSRAEGQVLRLSMIYALIDHSPTISEGHLRAALEVWRYVEESARVIFGDRLDDDVAQKIRGLLLKAGSEGMTRKEIGDAFDGHKTKSELSSALAVLKEQKLADYRKESTPGRPAERWFSLEQGAT